MTRPWPDYVLRWGRAAFEEFGEDPDEVCAAWDPRSELEVWLDDQKVELYRAAARVSGGVQLPRGTGRRLVCAKARAAGFKPRGGRRGEA